MNLIKEYFKITCKDELISFALLDKTWTSVLTR